MPMDYTQKAIPLNDGRRTSVRLDNATWELIDKLAALQGKNWRDWCTEALASVASEENMTAALRSEVSRTLVLAHIDLGSRNDDLARLEANQLTQRSSTFSDQQLADFLTTATVFGESDFGGFTIIFGHDADGEDFLVVKNNLRGGLHFATLAVEAAK